MNNDDTDDTTYKVVMNDEEQYSIWVGDRPNPAGWHDASVSGTKSVCLAYIKEVWTDMRPLSLRKTMGIPETAPDNSGVHSNGRQKS
jgi:MbtH protein